MRTITLLFSTVVLSCGDPSASLAPESDLFDSSATSPAAGGANIDSTAPKPTAALKIGAEGGSGGMQSLDAMAIAGMGPETGGYGGGSAASTEVDPCWIVQSVCYCGLPITAPGGSPLIVDRCEPPVTPNPTLEWCCDTWAGVCRCWQRQPGECQYWREEGSWVEGCSAV